MKFNIQDFYGNNKQLVDQFAHVLAGLLFVVALVKWVPWIPIPYCAAVFITMTFAYLREMFQHQVFGGGSMSLGSALDMGGWLVGCAIAAVFV
jgi:hypothetical protein